MQSENTEGFDYADNSLLNSVRRDLSQGTQSPHCLSCWRAEAAGGRSRRHSVIDEHDVLDEHVVLQSLDINVTWACNLACVMCGPGWSSTWAKELSMPATRLIDLGRSHQQHNRWMSRMDFSQIARVHFNGGEPLLNHNHRAVLERMAASGSLSRAAVSYNTNGTQIPDESVLDLWQQARLVKIYFSIDATGRAFEYIRYPASWNQVQDNIMKMLDVVPSNVMFGLTTTVGSYNVFEIADVWSWFDSNLATNREGDRSDFGWQPANGFDLSCLPAHIRERAAHALPTVLEFDSLRKELAYHAKPNDDWQGILDSIDRRRATNWRQALRVATYY